MFLVLFLCGFSGDPEAALRLTNQLIALGADVSLRSRWTNMNALHYAAYFDVPELIRVLLKASKPKGQVTYNHNISKVLKPLIYWNCVKLPGLHI